MSFEPLQPPVGARNAMLDGAVWAELLVRSRSPHVVLPTDAPVSAWAVKLATLLGRYGVDPERVNPDARRLGPLGVAPEILGLGVGHWASLPSEAVASVQRIAPAVGAADPQIRAGEFIACVFVDLAAESREPVTVEELLRVAVRHLSEQATLEAVRRLQRSTRRDGRLPDHLQAMMHVPEPFYPMLNAVAACVHHDFDLGPSVNAIGHLGERTAALTGGLIGVARGSDALGPLFAGAR